MADLRGILNIGTSALQTYLNAINVTGNNISNVNTPNYSKQQIILGSADSVELSGTVFGTGVRVEGVERVYDGFLALQIWNEKGGLGKLTAENNALERIEGVFGDLEGGLNSALDSFFDAIQNLTTNPSGSTERTALLSEASYLADAFKLIDSQLKAHVGNIDAEIKSRVDDINQLALQISDLNSKVRQIEINGGSANDLRDQRDRLVEEIANEIDITIFEDQQGMVTILVGNGSPLVAGTATGSLEAIADPDNNGHYGVTFTYGSNSTDITQRIDTGRLKGLINVRDTTLADVKDRIDLLSAAITKEINLQHQAGYGLDGSTGLDLFSSLTPVTGFKSANIGGAVIGGSSVIDLSAATLDDYEIRFTGSATFDIVNVTDGTTLSTGNPYTSGANIDFDGLRVVITDNSGPPQAGDVFTVSITEGASGTMGVTITDTDQIAAAADDPTTISGPDDNGNALILATLKYNKVLNNGSETFDEFYRALVGYVGLATRQASRGLEAREIVVQQLENYRDTVSGVSLEEEAVNLLVFQQGYQAAAKLIAVVDEMMETLLSIR